MNDFAPYPRGMTDVPPPPPLDRRRAAMSEPSAEVLAERIQALRELVYAHAKHIETEGKRTDQLADTSTRHEEQLNGEDGMRKQLAAIRSRMDDMVRSNNRLAWAMVAAALAFAADVARGLIP